MYRMNHTVRLSDTDVTGQVYYARPLEWMEWCRVAWFAEQYGNFIQFVEKTGITFFPSQVKIDYKKPMFFGDVLSIEMYVKELRKISSIFDYTIKRRDEIVLKSEIIMVCFDVRKKSLTRLSEDLISKLTMLQAQTG